MSTFPGYSTLRIALSLAAITPVSSLCLANEGRQLNTCLLGDLESVLDEAKDLAILTAKNKNLGEAGQKAIESRLRYICVKVRTAPTGCFYDVSSPAQVQPSLRVDVEGRLGIVERIASDQVANGEWQPFFQKVSAEIEQLKGDFLSWTAIPWRKPNEKSTPTKTQGSKK